MHSFILEILLYVIHGGQIPFFGEIQIPEFVITLEITKWFHRVVLKIENSEAEANELHGTALSPQSGLGLQRAY